MNLRPRLGIRTRIAGGSFLIAILGSLIAGIIVNSQVERIVRDGTTQVLRSDSAAYVVALQNEPDDAFDSPGPSQLVAVVAPDGTTAINTLPEGLTVGLAMSAEDEGANELHTAAGDEYVVVVTEVPVGAATWRVIAARNEDDESTVQLQLRALVIAGFAVLSLGVGAVAWALTNAALKPVRELRRTAERLAAADTAELLPVGDTRDEIAFLAETLNTMIDGLRSATDRERQLVADASHELRTPLAIVTTQLELARREASSVAQLVDDIAAAERGVQRITRIVNSLLVLSRLDDGAAVRTITPADELRAEVVRGFERSSTLAPPGVSVMRSETGSAPAAAHYAVSSDDLGRVLDNLVANSFAAYQRTERSGSALVEVEWTPQALIVTVRDEAGGVEPEFAPHLFERFTRADAARTSAPGHGAGLGLSIVRAIVVAADGAVEFENRPGIGLSIIVIVPVVAPVKRL